MTANFEKAILLLLEADEIFRACGFNLLPNYHTILTHTFNVVEGYEKLKNFLHLPLVTLNFLVLIPGWKP